MTKSKEVAAVLVSRVALAALLVASGCGRVGPGAAERSSSSYSGGGGGGESSTPSSTTPAKPGFREIYETCSGGPGCNNGTRLIPR